MDNQVGKSGAKWRIALAAASVTLLAALGAGRVQSAVTSPPASTPVSAHVDDFGTLPTNNVSAHGNEDQRASGDARGSLPAGTASEDGPVARVSDATPAPTPTPQHQPIPDQEAQAVAQTGDSEYQAGGSSATGVASNYEDELCAKSKPEALAAGWFIMSCDPLMIESVDEARANGDLR